VCLNKESNSPGERSLEEELEEVLGLKQASRGGVRGALCRSFPEAI
jgi:hypothetical protein